MAAQPSGHPHLTLRLFAIPEDITAMLTPSDEHEFDLRERCLM